MKHGTIAMVGSTPSIRIRDASESKLYDIRAKSLMTGKVYTSKLARLQVDDGMVHIRMPVFEEFEDVIFTMTEIGEDELDAWFSSDEETGFEEWRQARRDPREDPVEVAEKVAGTLTTDLDHEPDNGPGMDQNEPELTTLQVQILQELKENGEGTVAELLDRLNMPGMQAAIRKNLHILMDEKHLIGKRSSTPNGRPAQLWGVM